MAAPESTNAGEATSTGTPGASVRAQQPDGGSLSLTDGGPQPFIQPIQTSQATTTSQAATSAEPTEDSMEDIAEIALKNAPPWLISALFHTILMIVLALLILPKMLDNRVDLEATFADSDRLGDQLEFDSPLAGNDPEKVEEPVITPDDMPLVDDPFAAPPTVDLNDLLSGHTLVSDASSPNIGSLLLGREAGTKKALLALYGGSKTTEAAVAEGLKWLAKNQQQDGSWSLVGPYADGGNSENREAATAMALLAFQGAGHTLESGEYRKVVKDGWYYLLRQQDADGCFFPEGKWGHRYYTHAQATIAICELYAMTKDPTLRSAYKGSAEKAIDYCVTTQSPLGGWKYAPNAASDVSVTGWVLMGLQSARMAGLEVPRKTLDNITKFLDRMAEKGGSRYRYEPGHDPSPAMTAEGLLCRQYLGWKRNNPSLLEGVDWLLQPENQLSYTQGRDVYYWYYATQVMHHMEGEPWERWNRTMCQAVPKAQVLKGAEKGSWDPLKPTQDEWGAYGGRLYVTCLSIYMLEVYYRHLPLYSNPFMYMQ